MNPYRTPGERPNDDEPVHDLRELLERARHETEVSARIAQAWAAIDRADTKRKARLPPEAR